MRQSAQRQKVVSLVPDGASVFESSTPIGVWGPDRVTGAGLDVEFVACGERGGSATIEGRLTMSGLQPLQDHLDADLVIVPTWPVATRPISHRLTDQLAEAHGRGARLVGLCLGAFAVAATGLLDGRSATTHWRHRDRFRSEFPDVGYEPNTLYVDLDTIVTSAGSAAAVDCCLHLLRRDHGAEAAAAVARSMVTAPHRSGAQSQFASAPPIEPGDDPFSRALSRAAERIDSIGDVDELATLAGTSRRSLERRMRDRLGTTPGRWIDEQRVITACRLLETTDLGVEAVATAAGYGSAPTLRRALQLRRGTTPTAYRAAFGPPQSLAWQRPDDPEQRRTTT